MSVNEIVMFPSGPFDFFYAPHNPVASTVMNMTCSLTPLRWLRSDLITPNPKLKLLDQVREVMRLKHYSIRSEPSYGDWIRRYVQFHQMQSRDDLQGAEAKIELFLSDLAVKGHVAASTQNQAFNGEDGRTSNTEH